MSMPGVKIKAVTGLSITYRIVQKYDYVHLTYPVKILTK
jgi:hypothetical protein